MSPGQTIRFNISFPTINLFGYLDATRTGGRMDHSLNVDRLIDALIDREGGYVDHPADKGGPTCFGITEAVARAQGYAGAMRQLPREEAAAIYRRLYWLRPRFDEVAKRSPRTRRRVVRHRRQHGTGGRRDLPPACADRAQPQRRRLSRPRPRRPHRPTHAGAPSTPSCGCAAPRPAARPCCCARSRRCRASATSASPSAAQPMRPSSTGGSRTGLVNQVKLPLAHAWLLRTFANIQHWRHTDEATSVARHVRRRPALRLRACSLRRPACSAAPAPSLWSPC